MTNSIELSEVSKKYGKTQVLTDVSLTVKEGNIFGLLGPSGCGKTTTVKIVAGILTADKGIVKILDKPMPDFKLMEKIGYMAQSAALYKTLSAYENMSFFGSLYSMKKDKLDARIKEVADLVNLSKDLKTKVGNFSGGMQQRLSLGIALLAKPKILILDEPTVGIDPVLRASIWKELTELSAEGVTIFITTHVMDEASKCNQLAMMRGGRIIAKGSPNALMEEAKTDTIEDAFIYFGGEQNEN